MRTAKTTLCLFLSLSLLINIPMAYADYIPSSLLKSGALTSEYFVGKELGKPLIQVNLISGVLKPGVYHIPVGTNLGQLIAYAGGKNPKSNFSKVNIYREFDGRKVSENIDLDQLLENANQLPPLSANDIIYINEDRVTLEKTSQWVSIFAGILSIALSAALINQNNNNNNN